MTTEVITAQPIRYPAFGVPCGMPERLNPKLDFLQKSITCLSIAGITAAFAVSATALIIIAALSAITLVALAAINIYAKLTEHKRKLSFEDMQVPTSGVALGQWTQGNDVIVSNRVDDSFQYKKAIIRQAKKSIEISFNYGGGQVFRDTLALIEERMQLFPELKVHILISSDLLGKQDYKALSSLQAKHPSRLHYVVTGINFSMNPRLHANDNHCKMLMVDGKYFVTGGSGIDERMVRENPPTSSSVNHQTMRTRALPDAFRDTDVVGRGNLANLMREQFFRLYDIWEYRTTKNRCNRYFATDGSQTSCPEVDNSDRLITNTRAKFLVSGPEHRTSNPIVNELINRVNKAQREVVFANSIFMPPKKLREALAKKLQSRVSIKGVFAGMTDRDYIASAVHVWQSRSNYNLFDEVHEYQNPGQFLHKKVYLFDDRYAMVGTFNISPKSCKWDYEDTLLFDDPRVAQALKIGIEQDKIGNRRLQGAELTTIYKNPLTHIFAKIATNTVAHFI